jgi:hypothetical protein
MITRECFENALNIAVAELRKDSPDGLASVLMQLANGIRYRVNGVIAAEDGWVVLDVYEDGKRPIENNQESRDAGARRYVFERVIVPYEHIAQVLITARRGGADIGFGTH